MRKHPVHDYHDLSAFRHVFVCGDIHGEFEELDLELAKLGYDGQRDALVSVGDLIDRGPNSPGFLNFLARPNVFRVLGNHDLAPRMYLNRQLTSGEVSNWGGDWYKDLPKRKIEAIASVLEDAPFAMTVLTPGHHRVGFVHADCYRDWNEHIRLLEAGRIDVQDISVYSRETIKMITRNNQNQIPFDPEAIGIANIDHVFHGHTVVGKACTLANRSWIDTGVCFGYNFTVADVDTVIRNNPFSSTLKRRL